MAPPEHLRCTCPHCEGPIEFPPDLAGAGVDCPHCGTPLNLIAGNADAEAEAQASVLGGLRPSDEPGIGTAESRHLSAAELATALGGRIPRRPASWGYRLSLLAVAFAMVLLPLFHVLFLAVVAWATAMAARGWMRWSGHVDPGAAAALPAALHAAGVLLGLAVLAFLIKPWFARPVRRSRPLALSPAAEPLLFAFLHMMADTVGAPRPTRVQVDCRLNASAGFHGGWWGLVGGDFVLTLGLPLVAVFDLRQLAGVLAHELAHFDQGAGLRTSSLIRAVNAWLARTAHGRDSWDAAMDAYLSGAPSLVGRLLIGTARIGVGLSRAFFVFLLHAGHALSSLLLRQMEHDADRRQVAVAGSDGFEATLRRRHALAAVARDVYRQLRTAWESDRALPDNLPAALAAAEAALTPDRREQLAERGFRREADPFDAHPTDLQRLERAREAATPGLFQLDRPATALFASFETLARQATVLHCEDTLGIPRESVRWIPVADGPGAGSGGR